MNFPEQTRQKTMCVLIDNRLSSLPHGFSRVAGFVLTDFSVQNYCLIYYIPNL